MFSRQSGSRGCFQPTGTFSAWLIGIARHRAIDATRSRRHRARAREELLDDERVAGQGGAGDSYADVLMLAQWCARRWPSCRPASVRRSS